MGKLKKGGFMNSNALLSIAQSLDKLRGNKNASRFAAQVELDSAMKKVTAAMPWIQSWQQLSTIQIEDANNYSDEHKILIADALNAGAMLNECKRVIFKMDVLW